MKKGTKYIEMEKEELEEILFSLGKEFKKESLTSLIPSTLEILQSKIRKTPLLSRLSPAVLIALFFFISIPLFSFTPDPVLNIIKVVLLSFSFAIGSLFILRPEKMIGIDRKIIGNLLNRGGAATPLQEIILFRVQGLYFILIAFFVCRL